MSYQRMLDRVMQSGKRLLKEEANEDENHQEEAEVQEFGQKAPTNDHEREEFEDYVKHKVSSIRSNQDWLPTGLSVQVVSGKSVPKPHNQDRGGSKDSKTKVTVSNKRVPEKSPLNTSTRSPMPGKREPQASKVDTSNSNMPTRTQKPGNSTVNGMPLRSNPINQSTKNYGLATPVSKRSNNQTNQSARGSGVTSPRPAPYTPTRGGLQTPKQDSPISASGAGKRQVISVQEEFLKMHNRRQSTPNQKSPGQDSAISNKYSVKDGASTHLNSHASANQASLQETLDIYKKYDFLKNGKVKITHKTAKFLTTRIKPADCVVYLLDSLFLLMGDNKLKLDPKIRFIEYKQSLAKYAHE